MERQERKLNYRTLTPPATKNKGKNLPDSPPRWNFRRNKRFLELESENNYDISVGAAQASCCRENVCGDKFVSFKLEYKHFLILSDGMGVGARAARESSEVITWLTKKIEEGFSVRESLMEANKVMLSKDRQDTFATVDLLAVDINTGMSEIVKVGAPPSFIKREKEVWAVYGANIPVGILEELSAEAAEWYLEAGDCVIMMTDGVQSVSGVPVKEWMPPLLRDISLTNPQEVAEFLLEHIIIRSEGKLQDDCSILVAQL